MGVLFLTAPVVVLLERDTGGTIRPVISRFAHEESASMQSNGDHVLQCIAQLLDRITMSVLDGLGGRSGCLCHLDEIVSMITAIAFGGVLGMTDELKLAQSGVDVLAVCLLRNWRR